MLDIFPSSFSVEISHISQMEICNLGTVLGGSTQHRFTPYPSDTSAQQQSGFNLIDIL